MTSMILILVSLALGFSWGIQHEKKRIKKQIRKHGNQKRMELYETSLTDDFSSEDYDETENFN